MRSVKKRLVTSVTAVVVVTLCVTTAVQAWPQDPQAQGPVIRTQVNLVNVFGTVRDKSKRIVTDLKKEDFKLQEDGQDQQIAFFSREVTLPITLALLLDTSGSEQFMLGAIQDMGGQFLARVLRKGDEALVMLFDTDVDLLSDFTDDRGQLDRAIRKTRINAPMSGGGDQSSASAHEPRDGNCFLRRGVPGLQRKAEYRGGAQGDCGGHGRAGRRQ